MKTLMHYFIVMVIMASIAVGCIVRDYPGPYMYKHFFAISITDASGHDLVASLGDEQWIPPGEHTTQWTGNINPKRYDLSIVRSDKTVWAAQDMEERQALKGPFFKIGQKIDESHPLDGYLLFNAYYHITPTDAIDLERQLTYRFTCPEIFGDDAEHDIETFWEADGRTGIYTYPKCIKAFFEGKEIAVEKSKLDRIEDKYYVYCIKIVLDQ